MNMVRELRIKKGIQAKQLALEIGVSNATVSDWEHGRKNPTGERLRRLAEYFGVDEGFILGYGRENPSLYVPDQTIEKSQTEQIIERLMQQLDNQPRTPEARILAKGVDRLPQEQREQALSVFRAVFASHSDYFEKGKDENDT